MTTIARAGARLPPRVRILLLEPDAVRAQHFGAELARIAAVTGGPQESMSFELEQAGDIADACTHMRQWRPDILFANTEQPGEQLLTLLATADEQACPTIFLSETDSARAAVEALKAGACDFLVTTDLTPESLGQAIHRALLEWQVIGEHRRLQHRIAEIPQHRQHDIGRELHDGLGQQLAGLGMLAHSLLRNCADAPEPHRELAGQLASGLEQALAELRSIARTLVPVQMDAQGLSGALQELASRIQSQTDIDINIRIDQPLMISDNETATHVYRIVQEAINNALRHANARHIDLHLEVEAEYATIEVIDDGEGLPADIDERQGLGMRTMFHRCRLFGGDLDIFTADEGGTRVKCRFPLHGDSGACQ